MIDSAKSWPKLNTTKWKYSCSLNSMTDIPMPPQLKIHITLQSSLCIHSSASSDSANCELYSTLVHFIGEKPLISGSNLCSSNQCLLEGQLEWTSQLLEVITNSQYLFSKLSEDARNMSNILCIAQKIGKFFCILSRNVPLCNCSLTLTVPYGI